MEVYSNRSSIWVHLGCLAGTFVLHWANHSALLYHRFPLTRLALFLANTDRTHHKRRNSFHCQNEAVGVRKLGGRSSYLSSGVGGLK